MDNGRGRSEVYLIYSEESPEERRFAEGALRERLEGRGLTVRSEADFLAGTKERRCPGLLQSADSFDGEL